LFVRLGARLPAHATAAGKALLASLSGDELRVLRDEARLNRYTACTITSLGRLLAALERVPLDGYALSNQEFHAGVRALAVPVNSAYGSVVAAVDVTVYAHGLSTARLRDFVPALRFTAERVGVLVSSAERGDGQRCAPDNGPNE
jgi:IclR family transcriptional regulator, pca regulon regulatory protein